VELNRTGPRAEADGTHSDCAFGVANFQRRKRSVQERGDVIRQRFLDWLGTLHRSGQLVGSL
jgi:hypothetical protein